MVEVIASIYMNKKLELYFKYTNRMIEIQKTLKPENYDVNEYIYEFYIKEMTIQLIKELSRLVKKLYLIQFTFGSWSHTSPCDPYSLKEVCETAAMYLMFNLQELPKKMEIKLH